MRPPSLPVQPGQIIRGKYRIDHVLGQGGMAVVVAGQHVGLGQRVAIKFLHARMLEHREIVERFAREARAASRLESDHVARVTDVDVLDDGTPFMVMEYLEGHDLSKVRASRQPLPVGVAASYVLQACEAIGEAHELGIIHRDIKPANLFLARRASGRTRIKVLDFGISKVSGAGGDAGLTGTEEVVGSAHYMSPEQMLATKEVDSRTDIWALGATLFELVTARVPFPGTSVAQVAAMVMSTSPPPPSSLRPDVPPAIDDIVLRCLERDRSRRFGSVGELVAALTPFADADVRAAVPQAGARAPQPSAADGHTFLLRGGVSGDSSSSGGVAGQWASQAPMANRAWPPPASTTSGLSHAGNRTSSPSRAPLLVGGLLLTGIVAAGLTALVVRGPTAPPASVGASPPVAASATTAPAVETAPPVPVAAPEVAPSSSAAPPPASAVEVAPPAAPPSVALPRTTAQPAALRTSTPRRPTAQCNPPFTVDAKGVKRAKPECM